MEQSLCGGHRQQDTDLPTAARLSEHRDVIRITAELRDVVSNPAERMDDVEHADVTGYGEFRATEFSQVREAQRIEAVVYRDNNDVTAAAKVAAVVVRR
jgi:hypothetical protein